MTQEWLTGCLKPRQNQISPDFNYSLKDATHFTLSVKRKKKKTLTQNYFRFLDSNATIYVTSKCLYIVSAQPRPLRIWVKALSPPVCGKSVSLSLWLFGPWLHFWTHCTVATACWVTLDSWLPQTHSRPCCSIVRYLILLLFQFAKNTDFTIGRNTQ